VAAARGRTRGLTTWRCDLEDVGRLISDLARQRRDLPPPPAVLDQLTPRETEVLRLIARGLSNAEISGTLVITEDTARTDVRHILAKLNLRDRAQAVVFAYETGLVTAGG
jgi:DNA-binding NarL/FixJ family response regulator